MDYLPTQEMDKLRLKMDNRRKMDSLGPTMNNRLPRTISRRATIRNPQTTPNPQTTTRNRQANLNHRPTMRRIRRMMTQTAH
jgi:hypothetical protein